MTSNISVFVTGGYLVGKKTTISGMSEHATILQLAESFLPKLGFSFVVGSLHTNLLGNHQFLYRDGEIVCMKGGDTCVVEGTLGGSVSVTCVIDEIFEEGSMRIFVRLLAGETITLTVSENDTVKSVKTKIFHRVGIPVDSQRLIYTKYQLSDENILGNYNILNDCTLHLVFPNRGGGSVDTPLLGFVDVTSNKTEKIVLSSIAPDWRIISPGLTMEGVCTYTSCKVYNKLVLSQEQFGVYNLGKSKSSCPMCHTTIVPIRPIFYKCVVVYIGKKSDGFSFSSTPKTFEEPQSYKTEEAGIVQYKYLFINVSKVDNLIRDPKTNDLKVVDSTCHICHLSLEKEQASFPGNCGHMFHQACITKWLKVNKICPTCSVQSS